MDLPRKRCPKCHTVFVGESVTDMHSCDQCGNGYLSEMAPAKVEKSDIALPRSGGGSNVTHERTNF